MRVFIEDHYPYIPPIRDTYFTSISSLTILANQSGQGITTRLFLASSTEYTGVDTDTGHIEKSVWV